jgi:hypothetical protein
VRAAVVLCGLCACSFRGPGLASSSDDAPPPSDAPDAPVSLDGQPPSPDAVAIDGMIAADAPDACLAWMPKPKHFDPCVIGVSSTALALAGPGTYTFDTMTNTLRDPANALIAVTASTQPQATGIDASILDTGSFAIANGATLRVVGPHPLIIASWSSIAVAGGIDVGSHPGVAGAGTGVGPCTAATAGHDEPLTSGGSGGGGGGALRGNGGKGGPGDSPTQNAGGMGGAAVAIPQIVRGGCTGAASGKAGPGDAANPSLTSPGGAGGGGLQLTARTSAAISGKVIAGGQGGGGSATGSANGGGGGGSGGYVGIDAPTVTVTGTVAANGGGGGGSSPFAGTGVAGHDGDATTTAAPGGDASSCSLAGAVGSAGGALDGANAGTTIQACGGAGGGGGAGFVLVFATTATLTSATLSPGVQLNPF